MDLLAGQPNQLLAKDDETANELERASKLEGQITSFSADLQQALAQYVTGKDLFEGVKTFWLYKRRRPNSLSLNYVKEGEKLVADRAAIDTEFQQCRNDINKKPGWL